LKRLKYVLKTITKPKFKFGFLRILSLKNYVHGQRRLRGVWARGNCY